LRKLKEGPTGESYGIHVAALAGIPDRVIERAGEIMEKLIGGPGEPGKRNFPDTAGNNTGEARKGERSDTRYREFLAEIADLNPDSLTPMEALNLLCLWKKRFGARSLPGKARGSAPAKIRQESGETPGPKKPSPEAEPSLFD
jgi:DNA mismatch repair protein MutS